MIEKGSYSGKTFFLILFLIFLFSFSSRYDLDQTKLTNEIEKIRDGLKPKVSKLNEIEGKADSVKPFYLKAMTKDDLKFFG